MPTPLGCLIVHGFTSSLDTVRALVPIANRLGLPYRMPVLRGHGTRPEDLRGVTWRDWYADATAALHDLLDDADRVVVCGHSMGGLVALHLAAEHPEHIAGVATTAAALKIADPLVRLSPVMRRFVKMWKISAAKGFSDPSLIRLSTNYDRFALDALASLYHYGPYIMQLLPRVRAPLLLIHSRADRIIKPISAEIIYRRAGSHDKQLCWFERSGHEMLQDCQADEVVATIERFISRLGAAHTAATA